MKKLSKLRTIAIFSFILFSHYPAVAAASNITITIEGRVFTQAGPLPGAIVHVYTSYHVLTSGAAFRESGRADDQGRYKLQVPPGDYYMTANGFRNGKQYFSYHGANPIHVDKKNLWVAFMANEIKKPRYSSGSTSVKGVVTYKGKPVKNAYIAFYTLENHRFKGIGYKTESVKDDGSFQLPLPPSKYVIIARKTAGNEIRPLEEGDLYCYYPSNPVEVTTDKVVSVDIPCYPKADRSSFVSSPKIKTDDYVIVKNNVSDGLKFGITGKVANSKGEPVSGIYVLAYKADPGNTTALTRTFRGVHETTSLGKTDQSGTYFIPLDDDGKYAVIARSMLGTGTPKLKEIYGVYKNTLRKGLPFKKGQLIKDIDITVVTPPSEPAPGGK